MSNFHMPDHPVIRNLERTGYPDGKLPEVVCPNCGAACVTYYQDNYDDHIIAANTASAGWTRCST